MHSRTIPVTDVAARVKRGRCGERVQNRVDPQVAAANSQVARQAGVSGSRAVAAQIGHEMWRHNGHRMTEPPAVRRRVPASKPDSAAGAARRRGQDRRSGGSARVRGGAGVRGGGGARRGRRCAAGRWQRGGSGGSAAKADGAAPGPLAPARPEGPSAPARPEGRRNCGRAASTVGRQGHNWPLRPQPIRQRRS